ncbi:hypothetical protein BJ322DRAFT_1021705 [Thelephora terrestris]|uniref:Uncharacterized protein n=1 Tax=Thelephora terrestris TaxID=56493 RepID=A0A9P6L655_9AGAM|nr:hypothetical protein BJ322DRAFT_1021705 [Thelephora terrestris]
MHLNSLILSLVLTWASCKSAHAMPTSKVVVELSACGMTQESSSTLLSEQCQTVCQAVLDAQKHCKRDASCTCSAVLPDILQSCIQCSVDQVSQDRLPELLSLIPPRLRAYADICNQPLPEQQLAIFQNATAYTEAREASSSTPEPALTKREVDNSRCLFGLPEVVEMHYQWTQLAQSTGLQGLQPWPVFFFVFVAALCYAESRRSKRAGKV